MPLPVCNQTRRRARRFCIVACLSAAVFKAGPVVIADFTFEMVGYAIDRTLP